MDILSNAVGFPGLSNLALDCCARHQIVTRSDNGFRFTHLHCNNSLHYLWTVILTIKGIHVDQAVFDRLTKGQLTIITHRNSYAVISVPLADKIRARDELHFIVIADQTNGQLDEDDPYAAYQIPDDLMR